MTTAAAAAAITTTTTTTTTTSPAAAAAVTATATATPATTTTTAMYTVALASTVPGVLRSWRSRATVPGALDALACRDAKHYLQPVTRECFAWAAAAAATSAHGVVVQLVLQLPRQRRQLEDMKKKATLHLACLVTSFRHHIQFHLCHHHRQYAQHFSMATISMSLQHQWFLRHLSHGLRLLLDMLQHQSLKALLWTGEGTSPGLDQPLDPLGGDGRAPRRDWEHRKCPVRLFCRALDRLDFHRCGVSMLWQDARYDIASVS